MNLFVRELPSAHPLNPQGALQPSETTSAVSCREAGDLPVHCTPLACGGPRDLSACSERRALDWALRASEDVKPV